MSARVPHSTKASSCSTLRHGVQGVDPHATATLHAVRVAAILQPAVRATEPPPFPHNTERLLQLMTSCGKPPWSWRVRPPPRPAACSAGRTPETTARMRTGRQTPGGSRRWAGPAGWFKPRLAHADEKDVPVEIRK